MAEILEVKTVVDTTEGLSSMGKLVKKSEEFVDTQKEATANQKASGQAGKKAGEMTAKATGKAGKGFKALGTAIKGAGIGLLVGVIGLLVTAFKNNQKVMDVFTNVLGTISAIGTQVANVIADVVSNVSNSTGGFDKLTKVAKGLMTIALTPIKLAFYGIVLGVQEAQLAWEESFLGDKDPETIKELNAAILETKNNIAEVAFDAVDAGKSVVTNFAGAIEEVGKVAEGVIKGVKEISIEATYETVKANTELAKSAELAEAGIRGLIEKYDLQAEKLRQIRDDDRLTFQERIKANEDLAVVLKKQQEEQLKLAQVSIDAAKGQLALDKNNQEAKVALKNAENEYAATLAQVAGFEAEQLTNRNSLLKEQKQIVDELALVGKSEFERKKAEALQERNQRLIDAELAIQDEQALNEAKLAIEKEYTDELARINEEKNAKITEDNKKAAEEQKAIDETIAAAKEDLQNKEFAIANATVGFLNQIAGKNKQVALAALALEKGSAIAGVIVNAGKELSANAVAAALNPLNAVTAGAAGAAQLTAANVLTKVRAGLNIASITAAGISGAKNISSAGAGGSVGGVGGGARPSTETPRIPNFNAINQGVGGRDGFGSVRAVVIQQDIKDSASLDNRVDDLVKIGK